MNEQDDVARALEPVANAFGRLGIRYYVAGSVASSYHGAMRSTMDVDIVADLEESDATPLLKELGDIYYANEVAICEAIRGKSVFARAALGQLGSDTTFSVPIASAEDTIISKLEWYRHGGEVSERQWMDVTAVLKLLGNAADVAYLRKSAEEVGVADLLDRLLDETNL